MKRTLAVVSAAGLMFVAACGDDEENANNSNGDNGNVSEQNDDAATDDNAGAGDDDAATEDDGGMGDDDAATEDDDAGVGDDDAATDDGGGVSGTVGGPDRPSADEVTNALQEQGAEEAANLSEEEAAALEDVDWDCMGEGLADHQEVTDETLQALIDMDESHVPEDAEGLAFLDVMTECMDASDL